MSTREPSNIFERFLSPADRHLATHDLAKRRDDAIPVLTALFDGRAKNRFGVSYRSIGALGCGYVTIGLMGEGAKPLEHFVREGIDSDIVYAIEAAGRLGSLEKETKLALARSLLRNPYTEAAYSLVRCDAYEDPDVLALICVNDPATKMLRRAREYLRGET